MPMATDRSIRAKPNTPSPPTTPPQQNQHHPTHPNPPKTKQYETWERGVNEHGARMMLPTLQPGFNQARQIARERRAILDAQKLDKCVFYIFFVVWCFVYFCIV
jgi:hypothetical protein